MQVIKRTIPLSNYTVGREGKPITKIVMHWFGVGDLTGADNRFSNPLSKVSAHYGISNNIVHQWVDEKDTSYGAGDWNTNLSCINIEHDATTTKNASEETYQTAGQLLREICDRHNIPLDREHIIKHSQVKPTQCPGTLDVDKIISIAKGGSMSLTQDIPSEVEEKFGLKELDRYSKYWTYEELIADWVKLYSENKENASEKDKYKKEARDLRIEVDKLAKQVEALNKDVSELNKTISYQTMDIAEMQKTISKISNENTALDDTNKALSFRINYLDKENMDLIAKMSDSDPIKKYSSKELISEVLDRFFKGR